MIKFRHYPIRLQKYSYDSIILDTDFGPFLMDRYIVKHINGFVQLTLVEYCTELKEFGAYIVCDKVVFNQYRDAQKAIQYLNNKYATLVNLAGG